MIQTLKLDDSVCWLVRRARPNHGIHCFLLRYRLGIDELGDQASTKLEAKLVFSEAKGLQARRLFAQDGDFAEVLSLRVLDIAALEGEAHKFGELLGANLGDERLHERRLHMKALHIDGAKQ